MSGCPFGQGAGGGTPDGAAPARHDARHDARPETHHDAQLDFSSDMSYGDYLHLDQVLEAQHPLSPGHDEMLFIVQHQTSELWMKLMLHELHAAIGSLAGDQLQPAFKMLARVSKIMEQLVHAWDVLATMTPPEYSAIRPYLARSSGFQSWQYRCIEFSLGNKNAAMLKPHGHAPQRLAQVQAAYDKTVLRMPARQRRQTLTQGGDRKRLCVIGQVAGNHFFARRQEPTPALLEMPQRRAVAALRVFALGRRQVVVDIRTHGSTYLCATVPVPEA